VYPQHSYASAFLPSVTVAVGKVFICLWPSTVRCALLSELKHLFTASTSYPAWKPSFPYLLSASASATLNPSSKCSFSSFLADGDDLASLSYQKLFYSPDGRRPPPTPRAGNCPYPGLLPSLSATPLPFYRYPPTYTDRHRHPRYIVVVLGTIPHSNGDIWQDYSGTASQHIRGDAGCRLDFVPRGWHTGQ
jgi:hypothetical protein